MKTYLCKWKFYGANEWVTYKVRAYSKHAAFNTLIRKAQENHMIQICSPQEVDDE